ncbi:MAG: RtcB family protein [Deltaproteobacteria bacterium]|nr:RtcB family protein [Deltaproteobacteria bacterium]
MNLTLEKIDDFSWRLPKHESMNVDGIIYASEKLLAQILQDKSIEQVYNVASLPGIVQAAYAMPDIHWGYGFPIGGVAGFELHEGIVSPGGVGYDINCGVRLLKTNLSLEEVKNNLKNLVLNLFQSIPSGMGVGHSDSPLSKNDLKQILQKGAQWAIEQGWGSNADLSFIEEGGCLSGADPNLISERAFERGKNQLGTLGSGNHFLEIGYVDEIYDANGANAFGLELGQITVLIHSGSRGLGHQTCEDFLDRMIEASKKYSISLNDPQLACAPLRSVEGQEYLSAMAAAANFAFANRQKMTHLLRKCLETFFQRSSQDLHIQLIYDVCHNIAKFENHWVDGKIQSICVHRKGATRSLPAGSELLPEVYRSVGQPVLVPGDMGRYSFLMRGKEASLRKSLGSSCHGAGRLMSRNQAKKAGGKINLESQLAQEGIFVRGHSRGGILEEAPWAYKDVMDVTELVQQVGLSEKVVRLRPLGVIKG